MFGQLRYPEFKPPGRLTAHALGRCENWATLRDLLKGFKDFSVVETYLESHLRDIVRGIEASRDSNAWNILHRLPSHAADDVKLMEDLLALGIDPNPKTKTKSTPAHLVSSWNKVHYAEALALCRPDLSAKDIDGHTPVDKAKECGCPTIWDSVNDGFPTIAQLAHDKKWWVVRNLTRRGVVPFPERLQEYAGKDAIEWAEHYGEQGIADEMLFLLIRNHVSNQYFQGRFVKQRSQLAEESKKVAALQQKLAQLDQDMNTKLQLIEEEKIILLALPAGASADVQLEMEEETSLCAAKLADELRNYITTEVDEHFSRSELARRKELQEWKVGLKATVDAQLQKFQDVEAQAKLEAEMNVIKEGLTVCTSSMVEMRADLDAQMKTADALRKTDLEALESRLLSKVNSIMDQFQKEMKGAMGTRDGIVDAQIKAMGEEVGKLSIATAGFRIPAASHERPMAVCGALASNTSLMPSSGAESTAISTGDGNADPSAPHQLQLQDKSCLLSDTFALLEKYRNSDRL